MCIRDRVQLREKELPEADVQKEAAELLALCHRYGVKLILDDDVEWAAKVGADGVHICLLYTSRCV